MTSQAAYRVPDTPIAVPVQLRRYGLSEIVNHLLGSTGQGRANFANSKNAALLMRDATRLTWPGLGH